MSFRSVRRALDHLMDSPDARCYQLSHFTVGVAFASPIVAPESMMLGKALANAGLALCGSVQVAQGERGRFWHVYRPAPYDREVVRAS